jgi:hypothetical protein
VRSQRLAGVEPPFPRQRIKTQERERDGKRDGKSVCGREGERRKSRQREKKEEIFAVAKGTFFPLFLLLFA